MWNTMITYFYPQTIRPAPGSGIFRRFALASILFSLIASVNAKALDYHVGPEQAFASIGALPWTSLGPGDAVYIHWRAEPYREKILISNSGTATQPIRIAGVAGPQGQRPVIDGENATTSAQFRFPYSGTAARGLLVLSRSQLQQDGSKPKHIKIEGLELRNASPLFTFRDNLGASIPYRPNAASVFIERGEFITISNCSLNGSGNGFFVASGDTEEFVSREILAEGNEIFGNGNASSDREHNIYTAAIGMTFQFNRLGPLRPGALGNNLKDRSAGTVVRYNWIESGAQQLDLVDAEDSPIAAADPRYRTTYVYGNIFINKPANASLVHYGGDSSVTEIYRKGTLYFYHNTVIFRSDQRIRWRVALLRLETNDESADVRNNILYNVPDSPGAPLNEMSLMLISGKAYFDVNWVSEGWLPSRSGVPFEGTLTGTENLLTGTDPGFVSFDAGNFTPTAQSPCVDRAVPRAPAIPAEFEPLYSPLRPASTRFRNGTAFDLGALESGPAGALLSMQRLLSGEFQITLRGPAGNYRLESSADLGTWSESTTRTTTDGNLEFLLTGNSSFGFYRAVFLPSQ